MQHAGAFVVDAPPGHIDRLNLAGGQFLDRLKIAFADLEVILHHLPKRPEGQVKFRRFFSGFSLHIKYQPLVADRQGQVIRAGWHRAFLALRQDKAVLFQQVEHRHLALLIDLGRGGRHVRVIKRDMGDAGHRRILFAGDTSSWIAQP